LNIEIGDAFGTGVFGMNYLQANVINGIRFNSYFTIGFGIGLKYFADPRYNWLTQTDFIFPVFIDLRANLPVGTKISPYLSFDFGCSFNHHDPNLYSDYPNQHLSIIGLLLSPAAGASIKIFKKYSMNISVGYDMQKMPFLDFYWPGRNADGPHTDMNYSNSVRIIADISF
jgi:hypothetical protein